MKISIELNRSDLQVLAAIFLLMLPDYGALRGVEAGGSLLYLIHRNNVHADAMLGPIKWGPNMAHKKTPGNSTNLAGGSSQGPTKLGFWTRE